MKNIKTLSGVAKMRLTAGCFDRHNMTSGGAPIPDCNNRKMLISLLCIDRMTVWVGHLRPKTYLRLIFFVEHKRHISKKRQALACLFFYEMVFNQSCLGFLTKDFVKHKPRMSWISPSAATMMYANAPIEIRSLKYCAMPPL